MLRANDILTDISIHLLEPYVNTTVTGPVIHNVGQQVVNVGSARAVYPGALLICDQGESEEVITVIAVNGATVTAIFAKDHAAGANLYGATFPSGQTTHPLFTQEEVLGYLATVQCDFLTSVHVLFNTANVTVPGDEYVVELPDDSIDITSVDLNDRAMLRANLSEMDLLNPRWTEKGTPNRFFLDGVGSENMGVAPPPPVPTRMRVWYPQRSERILALNDDLMVPGFLSHILKYGAMYHCFAKDGEARDPQRADYCDRRYRYGLLLVAVFIGNMDQSVTGINPQREGRAPKVSLPQV